MRRSAKLLGLHRTTVARKLKFLASRARLEQQARLDAWTKSPFHDVQFDELETLEHTKCKPLSVGLVVDQKKRKILGHQVSQMPAKGRLAKKALKKYGYRPDHRAQGLEQLFERVSKAIHPEALITSDECPRYPRVVKRRFPQANHKTVKGQRGCIVGQGELKKIGFDPLFSLNHTCAMLRANINRLFRRTWCTTKNPSALSDHISLYVNYHNRLLTDLV